MEEELAARGARVVRARWERTAKNAPAENVYGDFGFTLVSSGDGFKEYELQLPRKTRLRHSATFRSIA